MSSHRARQMVWHMICLGTPYGSHIIYSQICKKNLQAHIYCSLNNVHLPKLSEAGEMHAADSNASSKGLVWWTIWHIVWVTAPHGSCTIPSQKSIIYWFIYLVISLLLFSTIFTIRNASFANSVEMFSLGPWPCHTHETRYSTPGLTTSPSTTSPPSWPTPYQPFYWEHFVRCSSNVILNIIQHHPKVSLNTLGTPVQYFIRSTRCS